MAIFLSILKIIGIILLCIIAFVLMLILLILFVPLRYKLFGSKYAEEDAFVKINISWLLHFLHINLKYIDKKLLLIIRVLGIPIIKKDLLNKEVNNKINDNQNKEKEPVENISIDALSNPDQGLYTIEEPVFEESIVDDLKQKKDIPKDSLAENENDSSDYDLDSDDNVSDDLEEKIGFWDKIKDFTSNTISKVKLLIENTDKAFDDLENKYNNISSSIKFYKRFVEDERNKSAFGRCVGEIKRIFKSILPRRINGYFHFGMEDPSTTGQILSYISLIYPFFGDKIILFPDFNDKIFEGNLKIRGRIIVIVMIIAAWRVYFNRDVKRLLRIYKKHKAKVTA